MIMNNGLSIKDKILNYLKKGVALATAAVTVIAASTTSAKAEGNSNIPNPTNIEEQTNAPIPSAGEDVIVIDEDIEEEKELTGDFLDAVVDAAFASLKKYNILRTPYNEKLITKMISQI